MENKSAEEVLNKCLKDNNCRASDTLSNLIEPEVSAIYEAMKEYALPAPVKEDLWEEVADIMRELSCSNLAVEKCQSHYIIQKKTN